MWRKCRRLGAYRGFAWARIGVKVTAKSRAGLSGLTIAKSSNLTNGAHKRVLLAAASNTRLWAPFVRLLDLAIVKPDSPARLFAVTLTPIRAQAKPRYAPRRRHFRHTAMTLSKRPGAYLLALFMPIYRSLQDAARSAKDVS